MDVHWMTEAIGVYHEPVLGWADNGVLTETFVEIYTTTNCICSINKHQRSETFYGDLGSRFFAEIYIGNPLGKVNVVDACSIVQIFSCSSQANRFNIIGTVLALSVEKSAGFSPQKGVMEDVDIGVTTNGEASFCSWEFDEKINPFSIADDKMSSILNALIEKRRICANHGKWFEFTTFFALAIAEGVAESGPGCVVGIEKSEAIDYTALQVSEVVLLFTIAGYKD